MTYTGNEPMDSETKDFIEYLSEARDEFVIDVRNQDWNVKMRASSENILIAYDQLRERYLNMLKQQNQQP